MRTAPGIPGLYRCPTAPATQWPSRENETPLTWSSVGKRRAVGGRAPRSQSAMQEPLDVMLGSVSGCVVARTRLSGQRQHRGDRAEGRNGRMPSRPLPQTLPGRCGSNRDWFMPQPAIQVGRDSSGGDIALGRLLLQALQTDGLQVAIHGRVELRRDSRLLLEDLPDGLQGRSTSEGRRARQALVENRANPVHVGCGTDCLRIPACLFGRHVRWGAEHRAD